MIFKNAWINVWANQMRASFGCYGDPTINRQNIDNQWEDAFRSNQKSVCIQCLVTHSQHNTTNTLSSDLTADGYGYGSASRVQRSLLIKPDGRLHWISIQTINELFNCWPPVVHFFSYCMQSIHTSEVLWPEVSEEKQSAIQWKSRRAEESGDQWVANSTRSLSSMDWLSIQSRFRQPFRRSVSEWCVGAKTLFIPLIAMMSTKRVNVWL